MTSRRRCFIPMAAKEVIKTVTELNKKGGVTVILITHYMDEVIGADKVFVMDDGEIVMEGHTGTDFLLRLKS